MCTWNSPPSTSQRRRVTHLGSPSTWATARAPPFGLSSYVCITIVSIVLSLPFCLISFSTAGNPHSKQECESSTSLAYKRRRLTFEYLLAGPLCSVRQGPHHVQVGRIGCPPHKHGPLDHCLEDSDHLSLLLVTSHFHSPHSWRCPNCDLKSHSSASPPPLGDSWRWSVSAPR